MRRILPILIYLVIFLWIIAADDAAVIDVNVKSIFPVTSPVASPVAG